MLNSGSHSALLDFLAFLLGTEGGTPVTQQMIGRLIIQALDWRVALSIYDYSNGLIVVHFGRDSLKMENRWVLRTFFRLF